ncbi:FAD-dependent monooxygenase [Staphylococcus condimenti]|nr:tetracycline resistance protein [Staphylococcus condimenti]APR59995.1 tetracycline resistance protein [Staphylococcus condimenti]OFP04324.1 tetracycline resistance protein [Staphylococcus sp. HMSC065E08]PNZ59165.1 FAD-dependent monooxygenase [Staphylococcus condimenti]
MIEMTNKKIGIIGGGPGGLMLGLLLQNQGLDVHIYEKADRNVNRSRGGSLDIHHDTGQLPLAEAGLLDEFKALARFEGEDTKIVDKHGHIYFEEDAEGEGGRPEIDRGELCDLIQNKIEPSRIHYGYKFESMETLEGGRVKVNFNHSDDFNHIEQQETEVFDLVIGSDGAFSKVRPFLADTELIYTGVSFIELSVPDVNTKYPDLAEYNKNGKMMGLGGDQLILGQLNGDGRIVVYVAYELDREQLDEYKALDNDALKARILEEFQDWDEDLLKYIKYSDDNIMFRRIYRLPIGFEWQHQPNVTLIGDAAHLMSPFAGEGVNMALYDAYMLAHAIADQADSIDFDKALAEYEANMYESSKERAKESQENLETFFREDAPEVMANFFIEGQKMLEAQNRQSNQ